MASTIPNEINLLGFSGNVLSLLFETLHARRFSGTIRIIKNLDTTDETPFDPGLAFELVPIGEWKGPFQNLLFGVGRTEAKKAVFKDFSLKLGISQDLFFSLVHPNTSVASTVRLDKGCYLEPGVVLSPFSELGFGVTVNRGTTIGHHASIGDFSSINPGVHIAGHSWVGEGVTIGMGTTVFDHLSIGAGSVIGGGSVVTKDIPPGVLAYGNPCRVIKQL